MGKHIITKYIRKIYITKLMPNLLFLGFCIFLWISYPFFDIMYPDTVYNLSDITQKINNHESYIQITLPTLYYSGYDCETGNNKEGSYYYTFLDDRCIFVLLSDKLTDNKAETIQNLHIRAKISRDKDSLDALTQDFAKDINWTTSDMQLLTTSFIISELDYVIAPTYFLLFTLIICSIYTVFYTFIYLYFLCFPHFSPMCRHLGSTTAERKNNLTNADYELKEQRFLYAEDMTITPHYFIEITKEKVEIIPLNSIIWAYKHSKIHKFGKKRSKLTYTLCLHTKYKPVRCYHKEKEYVDQILHYLETSQNNLLVGYSPENKKATLARKKNV